LTRPKKNSKDRKCVYPYTEWEHKRAQVKERLHRIPEYIHQAVETINREEQKMGRPPKLDLEKKVKLFILVRFLCKSNRGAEKSLQYFQPLLALTSATSTSSASTVTPK
jgi:hypothetical protein